MLLPAIGAHASRQVEEHGWVLLPRFFDPGDGATHRLAKLAARIGKVAPGRAGSRVAIEELRPLSQLEGRPHSLTQKHGLGPFPFHTDCAHYPIPSRFVLLLCAQCLTSTAPTAILTIGSLVLGQDERNVCMRGVFLVRNGRSSFYTSALSQAHGFLRFDEGCMVPVSPVGKGTAELLRTRISSASPAFVHWSPGDLLIIDNWVALHARAGTTVPGSPRLLLRAQAFSKLP